MERVFPYFKEGDEELLNSKLYLKKKKSGMTKRKKSNCHLNYSIDLYIKQIILLKVIPEKRKYGPTNLTFWQQISFSNTIILMPNTRNRKNLNDDNTPTILLI